MKKLLGPHASTLDGRQCDARWAHHVRDVALALAVHGPALAVRAQVLAVRAPGHVCSLVRQRGCDGPGCVGILAHRLCARRHPAERAACVPHPPFIHFTLSSAHPRRARVRPVRTRRQQQRGGGRGGGAGLRDGACVPLTCSPASLRSSSAPCFRAILAAPDESSHAPHAFIQRPSKPWLLPSIQSLLVMHSPSRAHFSHDVDMSRHSMNCVAPCNSNPTPSPIMP